MKDKKGFTLVELLAVIIVLTIILTLGGTSIAKLMKENKKNLYELDIANYISNTVMWAMDNTSSLPQENESISITLDMLLSGNYINEIKKNPVTDEPYDITICIFNTNGQYSYELLTTTSCSEMNR